MKQVKRTGHFDRAFKQRVAHHPDLVRLFVAQLELLHDDPSHVGLRNHPLKGKLVDQKSFAVTDNVRVIYRESRRSILLTDIGTHDEVYGP